MKFILLKTIKISVGALIATLIARYLGLNYYTSAGIIVILSVQDTRKESFKIANLRILASFIAIAIAALVFSLLDFSIYSYSVFLFIYILFAIRFKLQQAIVVNSVLVSHLLVVQSISISNIVNELSLMFIGVIVALVFNLYMPSYEKALTKTQNSIEELFKDIISLMSRSLLEHVVSVNEERLYDKLESELNKGKEYAYKNLNNYLFTKDDYYINYFNMRYQQFKQLKRMREHFKRLYMKYSVTILVADITEKLADSISKRNKAAPFLKELRDLRVKFKDIPLPKTRDEFENRAMLYQYLNDLEQFLEIKNEFHNKYD